FMIGAHIRAACASCLVRSGRPGAETCCCKRPKGSPTATEAGARASRTWGEPAVNLQSTCSQPAVNCNGSATHHIGSKKQIQRKATGTHSERAQADVQRSEMR